MSKSQVEVFVTPEGNVALNFPREKHCLILPPDDALRISSAMAAMALEAGANHMILIELMRETIAQEGLGRLDIPTSA